MKKMFNKVVERILSNWTALKLAVEHSMGGPNSKEAAVYTIDYIAQYLTNENGIEVEDIEDVLEDIMDQEFNTLCEDNSIKEISHLLFKFLQLVKVGDIAQLELEYNKLPHNDNNWLMTNQENKIAEAALPTTSENVDENMVVEDPEWTQVKSRRKR